MLGSRKETYLLRVDIGCYRFMESVLMFSLPTPRSILETLLPHLRVAAAYADQIQTQIATRPEKTGYDNFFATALSDADLSIQTFVEVLLLGYFPAIRFYGEEHEQTYNTKYFRAIDLGPTDDYLVTLDPIDGTRFYLDGHSNYQIILGVLNRDEFEAALAISPARNTYYYGLRNQGAFQGTLNDDLDDCQRLELQPTGQTIVLGWGMDALAPQLQEKYTVVDVANSYSKEVEIPSFSSMLSGEIVGSVNRAGQFIDSAALAFLAQEAGCIVTTLDGSPPPPLYTCENYRRTGLITAATASVHQHLLDAVQAANLAK
jgi:myo-inositol-1(or 4)-monophosphatase